MTLQNAPAGTIRASLRYPAFRWLLAGLAVSQIGDWLYNIALIALVFERTHSPLWAGITTAARVVPMVVLGPFGGLLADRFDRRRVMIVADLVRLVLMLLLALLAVAHLPVMLAPVIAALATAAATPYLPCVSAATPRLVADADLAGANAARSAVTAFGVIAGPALSGAVLLLGSPALAFVLNALTFGLSALAVLVIPAGPAFLPGRGGERPAGLWRPVVAGAAVLRAHPAALRLVGADVMCSLIYGAQTVLLLFVSRQIGLGAHGYGYLFAGIGAGGVAGTALAGRLIRATHQRFLVTAALVAVGLPMPLLALVHWPAVAIGLAALTGTGALLVEILTETGLQRSLDSAVFGRAYGLALPASIGGILVGSLLAPVLADLLGGAGALTAFGVAALACALWLLPRRGTAAGPANATQPQLGLVTPTSP